MKKEESYTPSSRFPEILVATGQAFQAAFGMVPWNEESRNVVGSLASSKCLIG